VRRKLIVAGVMIASVIVICIIVYFVRKRADSDLYVGEIIESVEVFDANGRKSGLDKIVTDTTVVFYIDKKCHPCMDKLPSIDALCEALRGTNLEAIVVWRKEIPSEFINEDTETYYYRTGRKGIASFTPCFFVIDQGKVVFRTDSFEKMVKKSISLGDINHIKRNILDNIARDNQSEGKAVYLAFCDDQTDISSVCNDYPGGIVVTISNDDAEASLYDPEGLLPYLFGIKEFPTVVRLSDEYPKVLEER